MVPVEWLERSLQPYFAVDEFRRYGGQRLFVLPQLDIAVAITGGNYADANQWIPPIRVIREVVLPGVL